MSRKPWEETWAADTDPTRGGGLYVDCEEDGPIVHGAWHEEVVTFVAQAPAMARLLLELRPLARKEIETILKAAGVLG